MPKKAYGGGFSNLPSSAKSISPHPGRKIWAIWRADPSPSLSLAENGMARLAQCAGAKSRDRRQPVFFSLHGLDKNAVGDENAEHLILALTGNRHPQRAIHRVALRHPHHGA